jgi:repressor LexA
LWYICTPYGEKGMELLTARQRFILDLIRDFIQQRGYPPTVRELVSLTGKKSIAGAQKILAALERKGYIRKNPGRSRGIELLLAPRPLQIPVVGVVPAGTPVLAEENIEGRFCLDSDLAPPDSFLLKVQGDSMIGDHIQDGDYVLVRPQPVVQEGDIMVAALDGEVTVKRFHREREHIALVPSNPAIKHIWVREGADLRIIGKVVAVFRFLGPGKWRREGD